MAGTCLVMNGTDNDILMSQMLACPLDGAHTLVVSLAPSDLSLTQYALIGSVDAETAWRLRPVAETYGIQYTSATGNVNIDWTQPALVVDTWYQIVYSREAGGTPKGFHHRRLTPGGTFAADGASTPVSNAACVFQSLFSRNSGVFFAGKVLDFRIYEGVLDQDQLTELESYGDVTGANLLRWYRLNETAGTTILDYSGNNVNGVLGGTVNAGNYYTGPDVPHEWVDAPPVVYQEQLRLVRA